MNTPGATTPAVRDIVLVGGGHAHVQVLKRFGMHPEAGVRLTLVNEGYLTPYSGMLPGYVAGLYSHEEIHIALDPLCRFANARFVHARVEGIDRAAREVRLAGRPALHYDVLSLNTGAIPVAPGPGSVTVKPIADFLPKWHGFLAGVQGAAAKTPEARYWLVIVGGGAGGFELALAARTVLPEAATIALVGPELLPGQPARAVRRAEALLVQHRIDWYAQRAAGEVADAALRTLTLANGDALTALGVFWGTGVRAPDWAGEAGLAVDEGGFIQVNAHLQSSDPDVFAAGDVAHLEGQQRPKAGVYAVRAGPVLARNLVRRATGQSLKSFRAQKRYLALIGTAPGRALALRGPFAWESAPAWRWKEWIDRRFMARFNTLPRMESPAPAVAPALAAELPDHDMRCGGCGAKLAAEPLRRVLSRLPAQPSVNITLGIGDDAAALQNRHALTLLTIDGFRAMLDDPYLFGRIAAHHSMNDIFAMGATPTAALAYVTLPFMADALMEADLLQLLTGVVDVLNAHGASLVGGHSAEGAELSLGLTVTGVADAVALPKGGAAAGHVIVLGKPLGTGVLLAAAMRGQVGSEALAEAVHQMDTSNADAADIFAAHGASAMTDVTGFGLAGHLGEMLRGAGLGARLQLASIPALPEACEIIDSVESSLQAANELALQDYVLRGALRPDDARVRLLADPQTSGGLLATVPAANVECCVAALQAAGYGAAAAIGEIVADGWSIEA